jgi:hypothetical protein
MSSYEFPVLSLCPATPAKNNGADAAESALSEAKG